MPLRTNDGKLLIRKFRLVKGREDECCCETDITCCGGTCIPPCCRVIVRFTMSNCVAAQGSCIDWFTGESRPAESAEDCTCTTINEYGYEYEVCESFQSTIPPIDIDITDSFSNQDSEDNEGGPCYAHFAFPTGSNPATSFYFTNAVSQNWSDVANWYRDENLRFPAGSLPSSTDKVYITAPINFTSAFRMANTGTGGVVVREIELTSNSASLAGTVTTSRLKLKDNSINTGAEITIVNRLDAENATINGTIVLGFRASAVFTGNTSLGSNAEISSDGGIDIVFADTAENNGTIDIEPEGASTIVFKNSAKNKGSISGARVRFFNTSDNEGSLESTRLNAATNDAAYEIWFISGAKNKGTITGKAIFYGRSTTTPPETGESNDDYIRRISSGNYGTVIGTAWFDDGADNYGTVDGPASFWPGNNYGTVKYGEFVSNITEGGLGFSGGAAANYGRVLKTAKFRGIGGDSQGNVTGAVNKASGCVGEWAWFDSNSVNLGQPNPDDAPVTGPSRVYYCATADCCNDENSDSSEAPAPGPQMRMAFTESEEPPPGGPPSITPPTDTPTPEEVSCQESLENCTMNFRVSSACLHLRDCPTGDGPSSCGTNCYYEIMQQTGTDSNGRPTYQYLYESTALAMRCYGISNIQIVEQCPDWYEPNNRAGGNCSQNLTFEQCRIRGSTSYTRTDPAFLCTAQPCDICCGPSTCGSIVGYINPDGSYLTAAQCLQCDYVCVDADGNERSVSSAEECESCYGDGYYDPYAPEPESEAPPCNPETFVQRGRCGKIISGTDGILQELAICATTSPRSHRCDYETEFPMVVCAEGGFIAEYMTFGQGNAAALPHAPSLGLSNSFTESFASPWGWGYSVGLNIGQGLFLEPDFCGGWDFSAYRDGRGGLYDTQLSAGGNYKPTTSCGTCHPESIEVTGAGSKWVVTNEETGAGERQSFTISGTVSFTEGYRCWIGGTSYAASCVPCSEIGYTDAPRGFVPPAPEYLTALPREHSTQENSSAAPLDASLAPPEEKELLDVDVPLAMLPALNKLRTAHPDKTIVVKKFKSGKYGFVVKEPERTQPILPRAELKTAEPKDCLYGVDDPTGVGTFLSSMLEKIGIKASPNCACKTRAKIMNCRGPEWCTKNIDTIVGWLREEATKRKLPFVDLAGKLLIKRAIGLARAAKKKEAAHGAASPHSSDS